METPVGSHKIGPSGRHPGELEGRFHRLGTRVTQEGAVQPRRCDLGQERQELGPSIVIEDLRTG